MPATNNPAKSFAFRTAITAMAGLMLASQALAAPRGLNDFQLGMAKARAEQLGAESCRVGTALTERRDRIYCQIPLERIRLGKARPDQATLEFDLNTDKLSTIRVHVPEKHKSNALQAMGRIYGQPRIRHTRESDEYVWPRKGDGFIQASVPTSLWSDGFNVIFENRPRSAKKTASAKTRKRK